VREVASPDVALTPRSLRVVVGPSAASRLALVEAALQAKPSAEEVLLLGGSRLALDERARRSAAKRPTFGVFRATLLGLAGILAAAPMAERGLAPSSTLGGLALVARAVFEARAAGATPFMAPVAGAPSFARTLAATLDELRLAGLTPEALPRDEPASRDLAELLRRHGEVLTRAGIVDRASLLALATEALAEPSAALASRFAAMPKVLLDLAIRSRAEERFVGALLACASWGLVTVPSGDQATLSALARLGHTESPEGPAPAAPTSLARLQTRLFEPISGPEDELAPKDESVVFWSAPGEGREAVEIARRLQDEAKRGVPFDAMAVLLRSPELYREHLEHALRRASIPAYFAMGTKRPHPAGRAFRALLACAREGLSAERFAEYLSLGQVPNQGEIARNLGSLDAPRPPADDSAGAVAEPLRRAALLADSDDPPTSSPGPLPPGELRAPYRWEKLLVEASVLGGKERWARRLAGLAEGFRARAERLRRDEPEHGDVARLEKQLADLEHLRGFALPVLELLATFSEPASWGTWLTRLRDLAARTLRRPEAVLALLVELGPMATVGPVGLDEVADVLADPLSLTEEPPPAHRYGRVLVASVAEARGLAFRVVFVPGLAERLFPRRPREDPLLVDDLRRRLEPAPLPRLRTQADRSHDERLLLRVAVGAATERVLLSYPRVETAESRPRVPSFYGLDVLRATSGVLPDTDVIERDAARVSGARLAWPAPDDPRRAIDDPEHDLAVLGPLLRQKGDGRRGRARYLFQLHEHMSRSLRARYWRWESKRWGPADGLVRPSEKVLELLAKSRPTSRSYSPTALQHFAACPYRFYLAAVLGLSPREPEGRIEEMMPDARGEIFHDVQAKVLRELRDEGSLPLEEARWDHAVAVLERHLTAVATEWADALAPPIQRVWDDDVARMHRDLLVWLKRIAPPGGVYVPAHFELRFGIAGAEGPDVYKEPARLGDGFLLRGAVDLVERRADGRAYRVTDYKTGANKTREDLVIGGGEVLQPVLYGLAVESLLGQDNAVVEESRLYFCTTREGYAERIVPMDDRARRAGLGVLTLVDRAISHGQLLPTPRADACKYCSFRPVCGPHEEERSKRKKDERDLSDKALPGDLAALRGQR
jgi:ATP-dependent helicase/nuclease subunit B